MMKIINTKLGMLLVLLAMLVANTQLHAQTEKRVVVKTYAQAGETIRLRIKANGNVTVTGVQRGVWDNDKYISYTIADGQTLTFTGDITKVVANDAMLSDIDVTAAPSLNYLEAQNNQIKQLDLSKNLLLSYLYVQNNQLEKLVVARGGNISRIYCNQNKLKMRAMEELIESLPDRTTASFFGELGAIEKRGGVTCLNECSKTLVEKAQGKNWIVKARTDVGYERYEGSDDPNGNNDKDGSTISFETSKPVGSTIELTIQGNGKITLEGVKESAVTLGKKSYTITSQKLAIKGNVEKLLLPSQQITFLATRNNKVLKELNCANNPIRLLNLSSNSELVSLNCSKMQLQSLDLSKNTKLTIVDCSNNQLTDIDLSSLTNLVELNISNNKIAGKWMEQVTNTLADRLATTPGKIVVINLKGNDDNICSKRQVKLLLAKHWDVFGIKGDNNQLITYEGSKDASITFHTTRKVGEKLNLKINAEGGVTIDGLKGKFQNYKPIEYIIEKQDITIFGDITSFHCYKNDINSIDLSNATYLLNLDCSGNKLDKTAMEKVIESLIPRANTKSTATICVLDESFEKEANVCTKKTGLYKSIAKEAIENMKEPTKTTFHQFKPTTL